MKKIIFAFLTITLLFSCKEDDQLSFQEQLDADIIEIEQYLADNGITAIKDATGVFYKIDVEGSGNDYPTSVSTVSMAYTGKLMDGSIFDSATSTTPLNIGLSNTIGGWQVGVPKYKKGGKGTLYIPSGYAYGSTGSLPVIEPNTILIFDIELLNFQ